MTTWEKFDLIQEELGSELLLLNIAKAIGDYELNDVLDYIIRCFDLEFFE